MSLKKRIFSYLIAVCMLLCIFPAAYASVLTYEVEGDAYLFAPPAGVKSAVTYKLIETDTSDDGETVVKTVVEDAVLTTEGTLPSGVSIFDNMLLLDGDTIKSGSFTVKLTAGDKTASLTVAVQPNRIYADFEDLAPNTGNPKEVKNLYNIDTGVLSSISGVQGTNDKTITTETVNGLTNNYIASNWNAYLRFMLNNVSNWNKTRNITVDVMTGGSSLLQHNKRSSEMTPTLVNLIGYNENQSNIVFNLNSNTAAMKHVQLNLDFRNRTYNAWVDGDRKATDAEINSNYDADYLDNVRFYGGTFDNFAIYSGTPVTGNIAGASTILAPPVGQKAKLTYTMSTQDGEALNDAVWSISGTSLPGVSISADGVLTLDGSAMNKDGSFTIEASAENGVYIGTKTVTVNKYRYFEDFDNQTTDATAEFYLDVLDASETVASNVIAGSFAPGKIAADGDNEYCAIPNGAQYIVAQFSKLTDTLAAHKNSDIITVSFKVKGVSGNNFMINNVPISYINSAGYIGTNSSNLTDVKVPTNEWAEIRVTIDFSKKLYSVWADDCLVYKDLNYTSSHLYLNEFYARFPFDDLAVYSGEKVTDDTITVNGNAYVDNALTAEGTHIVKAIRNGVNEAGDSPAILLAEYSGGVLENLKTLNLGSGILGEYTLAARLTNVEQGHTVKVFLWDMNSLIPISDLDEID